MDNDEIIKMTDEELERRAVANPRGHAFTETAILELEKRNRRRLALSIERIEKFAARTEKSGGRMELATWVILFATLAQLVLIVVPMVRENHSSASPVQPVNTSSAQTASLDLQEKCAKQAQQAFKRDGFEKEQLASFSNHYSEKLNKCFVRYDTTDASSTPGIMFVNKVVSDAFEGKVYGEYMWRSDKVKKYWEVPPVQCTVTLPSGEEKTCHSPDEFDTLVKQYME